MNINTIITSIFIGILLISTAGCSTLPGLKTEASYPKNPKIRRREDIGRLSGSGGFTLFGGNKGKTTTSSSSNSNIGINSYLWKSSLDIISFMPLASADPFGGVIITDWYEDPNSPKERFKVNIFILDSKLHANAIKISVFKQTQNDQSQWVTSAPSQELVYELEKKILTKARSLRVEQES